MRSSKRQRNNPIQVRGTAEGRLGQTLATTIVEAHTSWEGPLPSPQTLEGFKALVQDAPERIFAQWEEESAHRRKYEKDSLRGTIVNDRISRLAATAFALGALGVVIFALWVNQPWVAGVIGGTTIGSVVGAFLYVRRKGRSTMSQD